MSIAPATAAVAPAAPNITVTIMIAKASAGQVHAHHGGRAIFDISYFPLYPTTIVHGRSSKTTNAAYKFVEQSDVRLWHLADAPTRIDECLL
jgi:hypothetical protein